MSRADPEFWTALLRKALRAYDETFLRDVASRLVRPRNQWPVDELIDRAVGITTNPAVIDRRLKELSPAGRRILACIAHSRQPCWPMGSLVEIAMALGQEDGLEAIRELAGAGALYPTTQAVLASPEEPMPRIRGFAQWLQTAGAEGLYVFAPPLVAERALGEDLGLPDLSEMSSPASRPAQEADGLEWPLRLAALWQQVTAAPLRRTQLGGYFKRDSDRLAGEPLLNAVAGDQLVSAPDLGFLLATVGEIEGILVTAAGESRAGSVPAAWDEGIVATLTHLFADLPRIQAWSPLDGWRGPDAPAGNPFISASLLALLLLARLPAERFASPSAVETWIHASHPYWAGESMRPSRQKPWVETFLLGVAYPLRLVQIAQDAEGGWLARLSPLGRGLLGVAEVPELPPSHAQTLTVQPNLDIIAYRQGLTPGLISRLARFATWKNLGSACTLQLEPESVYRALELGDSFETIRQTLDRHGTRAVPDAVLDSLRTWADKRDRITVYPSATLLEFDSPADLDGALARGVPAVRLTSTLAVLASESDLDYRHFRLIGARDYGVTPEKCATVEPDGVTIVVDATRSDLLLETELPRFAEPLPSGGGTRRFRLTPASMAGAREAGWSLNALDVWFQQRTGQPLPPAARLFMTANQLPPAEFRRHLVVHVATPEAADGLLQWPRTRELIAERLGPTAMGVDEENVPKLRELLSQLGVALSE